MEQSNFLELYDKAYTILVVIPVRSFDFMNFNTVKVFVVHKCSKKTYLLLLLHSGPHGSAADGGSVNRTLVNLGLLFLFSKTGVVF